MNFTHIIFDMDGTLTDTVKATFEACRKTSDEMSLPRLSEDTLKEAMGLPGLDYFRRVLPNLGETALRKYARMTDAAENAAMRRLGKTLLFDGIEALLDELSEIGAELFIASTGSLEHVGTALEAAGIRKYFAGVYCDNPDKVESIGRILKLREGGKWIMVGDKRIDANAARRNGIFSAGAGFGYCVSDERAFFDRIVFSTEELLRFIRGM